MEYTKLDVKRLLYHCLDNDNSEERAVQEDEYWLMCHFIDNLLRSEFEFAIEDLKEWREDAEEAVKSESVR